MADLARNMKYINHRRHNLALIYVILFREARDRQSAEAGGSTPGPAQGGVPSGDKFCVAGRRKRWEGPE